MGCPKAEWAKPAKSGRICRLQAGKKCENTQLKLGILMFIRILYTDLLEWKASSHGTTALLIEGARRVGKTTLVRDYAEREYAAHIYIDFANVDKAVTDLFVEHRGDIGTFLRMLQLYLGTELPQRNFP